MSSQPLPAQAKELLRYLFEQASLGIVVGDLEGAILLANPALCSILGCGKNELGGMNCSRGILPEGMSFEVGLWRTPDEIHLAVSDRGVGFDSKAAKESPGLGLVSMEERLKLLKGSISIKSQPNRGTTIHARLPLS